MGIETKTPGILVDELITTVIKCFYAQEDVMQGDTEPGIAAAAVKTQVLNARRNELIRALDQVLGASGSPTSKTYGPTPDLEEARHIANLEVILADLVEQVLHPTDSMKTRNSAQAALHYLESTKHAD